MLSNRKQHICKDIGSSCDTDHPRLYDVKRKLVSWCHKPSGGAGDYSLQSTGQFPYGAKDDQLTRNYVTISILSTKYSTEDVWDLSSTNQY